GSQGKTFAQELTEQRKLTDGARAKVLGVIDHLDRSAASPRYTSLLTDAQTTLAKLDATRQQIDALTLPAADSAAFFTSGIRQLLDAGADSAAWVTAPAVSGVLAAYTNLLEAKERAGQERAAAGQGFAAGQLDAGQFRRYVSILAEQSFLLRR